jgi:Uma2 family endonuclease
MQIELLSEPVAAVARWHELLDDPELARWPGRIETDRFGRIIMSPPPGLPHGSRQSTICQLLAARLPDGQVITECPLVTLDGVKGIDVAWLKGGRTELAEGKLVLERAPEICVEVLSPSNSEAEMEEKRLLYFAAGAQEVWLCGRDGKMEFYTPVLAATSRICPLFPGQL